MDKECETLITVKQWTLQDMEKKYAHAAFSLSHSIIQRNDAESGKNQNSKT